MEIEILLDPAQMWMSPRKWGGHMILGMSIRRLSPGSPAPGFRKSAPLKWPLGRESHFQTQIIRFQGDKCHINLLNMCYIPFV
jgi:hypothetical protein